MTTRTRKKLIEVALPLEAINAASAREKSIRHGHPSTLHLWWARRPLAAARAVIFAQMVDDPSAWPELFPTVMEQDVERGRLFRIIENLVKWENTGNETVLQQAREEIWASWRRACAENLHRVKLFNPNQLPGFHDPFAGGGTLPLEAQRLGLEAHASDLNPVAVLINKATIEIPAHFTGWSPVNPERDLNKHWKAAQGLADDVRYYSRWMRDQAEKRIGRFYPKIEVTAAMAAVRPDLKAYEGQDLTVIAWIWARTVRSPNPAFADVEVPLASTFMLGTKPGKEAWIEPIMEPGGYSFSVKVGAPHNLAATRAGTKLSRGASFRCLMSGTPITGDYIKAEGEAGRIGARLMAIVAEGVRGRIYLSPTEEHEALARQAKPDWEPEGAFVQDARAFTPCIYGIHEWRQLFTPRQLVALTTLSELLRDAVSCVRRDALAAEPPKRTGHTSEGADWAESYAQAVGLYLALAIGKLADNASELCSWHNGAQHEKIRATFGRQALAMTWDFAEGNIFSESTGNFRRQASLIAEVLENALPASPKGCAMQSDAQGQNISSEKIISTDPPYYDNVPYADLSDYFYVWLRRSLRHQFPDLFATLAVPKADELVAFAYRHNNSKLSAEKFFVDGMTQAMQRLAEQAHPDFPVTIYYAFKQFENGNESGSSSTGWETFLDAVIRAGFATTGTWPVRTELSNRMRGVEANALASSIVLVCRQRSTSAPTATRREFIAALKTELPIALRHLQASNIAPVDLAQASIGPGMGVFTRYARVLDAEGKSVSVREALTLINATLDEALAEQEGDFDADSRWALAWSEQNGFAEGPYGVAETLSKAKNTSVTSLAEAGILESKRGRVRLLKAEELPSDWDPTTDPRISAWETVHHLIRALAGRGEAAAAALMAKLGARAEIARELAYRLYVIAERKKRAADALSYNSLVQSWPEIARLAREGAQNAVPTDLFEAAER